jgi:hypothetical protein
MKLYALTPVLLTTCAIGLLMYHQPATVIGAPEAAKQKWEYKRINYVDLNTLGGAPLLGDENKFLAAGLNKLGDEGWELVAGETSTKRDEGFVYYVFKRAK